VILLRSTRGFSGAVASRTLRLAEARFGMCCLKAISGYRNEDILADVVQKDADTRRTGVSCSGELGRFFDLDREAVRF